MDFGAVQPASPVDSPDDADKVAKALVETGPLALVNSEHVDRLELNMQIVRLPASIKQDFGTHAEYLLVAFNWDLKNKIFEPARLENQIDRNLNTNRALPKDAAFVSRLADFKREMFKPAALADLDRGRLVIPERFLSKEAVSVAPGGRQPFTERSYQCATRFGQRVRRGQGAAQPALPFGGSKGTRRLREAARASKKREIPCWLFDASK